MSTPKPSHLNIVRSLECTPGKTSEWSKNKTSSNQPCLLSSTSALITSISSNYKEEAISEVTELSEKIETELKNKLTKEEEEFRDNRIKTHDALKQNHQVNYPRFKISEQARDDFLYYGIQTGRYSDVMRFLGERECNSPDLAWINSDIGYLGLFFSINQGRAFGGIVRIINEKDVTPIESEFYIQGFDKYFEAKLIPSGNFEAWLHSDDNSRSNRFQYQSQKIHSFSPWEDEYFVSPWLYNSCNKSIATISNFCSLDSGLDIEVKEFFYLSDHDLMLGNIYCKKSNDISWKRLATLEMVRTR